MFQATSAAKIKATAKLVKKQPYIKVVDDPYQYLLDRWNARHSPKLTRLRTTKSLDLE